LFSHPFPSPLITSSTLSIHASSTSHDRELPQRWPPSSSTSQGRELLRRPGAHAPAAPLPLNDRAMELSPSPAARALYPPTPLPLIAATLTPASYRPPQSPRPALPWSVLVPTQGVSVGTARRRGCGRRLWHEPAGAPRLVPATGHWPQPCRASSRRLPGSLSASTSTSSASSTPSPPQASSAPALLCLPYSAPAATSSRVGRPCPPPRAKGGKWGGGSCEELVFPAAPRQNISREGQ
jgi:hypothetical protein